MTLIRVVPAGYDSRFFVVSEDTATGQRMVDAVRYSQLTAEERAMLLV